MLTGPVERPVEESSLCSALKCEIVKRVKWDP